MELNVISYCPGCASNVSDNGDDTYSCENCGVIWSIEVSDDE